MLIFPAYRNYKKSGGGGEYLLSLGWIFLCLVCLFVCFNFWCIIFPIWPLNSLSSLMPPPAAPQSLPSPLLPLGTWQTEEVGRPQGSVCLLWRTIPCPNSVTHAMSSLSLLIINCRSACRLVIRNPIT